MNFVTKIFIMFIKIYQYMLSPLLGSRCRFYPSCSHYGIMAMQKYGVIRGNYKLMIRLFKCHPFHKGGVDFP